jgi:hypothetical protein
MTRRLLLILDETLADALARTLADHATACAHDGWAVSVMRVPRGGRAAPEVVPVGRRVREEYARRPFDALLVVGCVPKPYSGTGYAWNGGHYAGACLCDAFYAAPWVPIDAWTSRDKVTAAGASSRSRNAPDDNVWDVNVLRDHPASLRAFGPGQSLHPHDARPVLPHGRIDASGICDFLSRPEVDLVREALERSTAWRMGLAPQLLRVVLWDSSFEPSPGAATRAAWAPLGAIQAGRCVGDDSGTADGWRSVPLPDAIAYVAGTGGGPLGDDLDGQYLHWGSWHGRPTDRSLRPDTFLGRAYPPAIWQMWGSYVGDLDAPRSLLRIAYFAGRNTVHVTTDLPMAHWTPGATFGDLWARQQAAVAKNPNNAVGVLSLSVGDPTLPVVPPATPRKIGDVNLDGVVNFADLLTLAQNYGKKTGALAAAGDLDGSGVVDFADLLRLQQEMGK